MVVPNVIPTQLTTQIMLYNTTPISLNKTLVEQYNAIYHDFSPYLAEMYLLSYNITKDSDVSVEEMTAKIEQSLQGNIEMYRQSQTPEFWAEISRVIND